MGATLQAPADAGLSSMLNRIVELKRLIDEKAEETKPLATELAELESMAVEQMGLNGVRSLGVDGGTFTIRQDIQCSVLAARRQECIEVAAKLGIDNVVTVQTGTIKAYIKEQLKALGEDLESEDGEQVDVKQRLAQIMPELAPLVSVFEKTSLVFRKR